MGIKGISITKELIDRIIEYDITNLTLEDLRGLEVFNSFNFQKMRKREIELIINAFKILYRETNLLDDLSCNQEFYLNLDCLSLELDLITILNHEDTRLVFNIEVKDGKDNLIINQITKRVNEQLPSFFQQLPILSLGFNEEFAIGMYRSGEDQVKKYLSLNSLDLRLKTNLNSKEIINQINILTPMHELLRKAEKNELKYHRDTRNHYKEIIKHMQDNNSKITVVNAKAGYGKTVLALKLFFKLDNIHMLMLNQKFYQALKLGRYYSKENKILYGTNTLLTMLNDQIVVIDEAQRIYENDLLKIINKASYVIWIGDFNQAIHTYSEIEDKKQLFLLLENSNIPYKKMNLSSSKRYDKSVDRAVSYLLGKNNSRDSLHKLHNYNINIYYNEEKFYNKLIDLDGKLFLTNDIGFDKEVTSVVINKTNFNKIDKHEHTFPIREKFDFNFGYTMNALSFDVNNNFVYLKDVKIDKELSMIIPKKLDHKSVKIKKRYRKELYTLFTRGKKSLNILVIDIDVFLYLNKRLKDIKGVN